MFNSPLGHLRVVDLTDLRGALAGRLLADLGADVVKIEPAQPDEEEMESLAYLYRNANKRGAFLDLDAEPGRQRTRVAPLAAGLAAIALEGPRHGAQVLGPELDPATRTDQRQGGPPQRPAPLEARRSAPPRQLHRRIAPTPLRVGPPQALGVVEPSLQRPRNDRGQAPLAFEQTALERGVGGRRRALPAHLEGR